MARRYAVVYIAYILLCTSFCVSLMYFCQPYNNQYNWLNSPFIILQLMLWLATSLTNRECGKQSLHHILLGGSITALAGLNPPTEFSKMLKVITAWSFTVTVLLLLLQKI